MCVVALYGWRRVGAIVGIVGRFGRFAGREYVWRYMVRNLGFGVLIVLGRDFKVGECVYVLFILIMGTKF